jgi:hypothetical protein
MKDFSKPYTHLQEGVIDHKNKFIMLFTPRAGCTIGYQMIFEHLGIRQENIACLIDRKNLHKYRYDSFHQKNGKITEALLKSYRVFKLVRNPYARAVSSFLFIIVDQLTEFYGLSFHEYLTILKTHNMRFIYNGKEHPYISRHAMIQYDQNEETYLTDIIKLEQAQSDLDLKINGPLNLKLQIDNKNSNHHINRTVRGHNLMYAPINAFKDMIPISYKEAFYDETIKVLVDDIYGLDIQKYGYSFDENF